MSNCYTTAFAIAGLEANPGSFSAGENQMKYMLDIQNKYPSIKDIAGWIINDLQRAGYDWYKDFPKSPCFACNLDPSVFPRKYNRMVVVRCVTNPQYSYDFHCMYTINGTTWYGNYYSPDSGTPVDPNDDYTWEHCDSQRIYFAIY